jgi:TPR repeat protein
MLGLLKRSPDGRKGPHPHEAIFGPEQCRPKRTIRHNAAANPPVYRTVWGAYGMNRTIKAAVAALIFAVGFAGSVAAGPYEDATAAYNKDDYAAAASWYRKAAEQGDARAQFNLGIMYAEGEGVPQDYAVAASWFRKAAEQNNPSTFVVIIAAAAFLAGLCGKRLRAKLARQAWQERRWRSFKTEASPVTDPAEQLRFVMAARFEKRRLLSRSEAQVLYAAERAVNAADRGWRVMAQVSLGEVLSSPDARAYSAINSKRVDLLIVSRSGDPIAAIEYQGQGHYQGTAAARDAVKKEALRKAGVRYIEVTPESGTEDMTERFCG